MVTGVVEAIYKLKYFNFLSTKSQGNHRKFCLDGSVATLLLSITYFTNFLLVSLMTQWNSRIRLVFNDTSTSNENGDMN